MNQYSSIIFNQTNCSASSYCFLLLSELCHEMSRVQDLLPPPPLLLLLCCLSLTLQYLKTQHSAHIYDIIYLIFKQWIRNIDILLCSAAPSPHLPQSILFLSYCCFCSPCSLLLSMDDETWWNLHRLPGPASSALLPA